MFRVDSRASLARLVGNESEVAMSTSSVVSHAGQISAVAVRNLIAEHLGVDAARVSNDARLRKDLGAGWLDRLELMIAIEDRFGVEIGEDVGERIEAVGDLIRVLEGQPLH
jgi:acyl carrier protein